MVTVDFVFIAGIALFAFLGLGLGFGKQLSFFTKGIFGFLISVFVCYLLFGFVYNVPFVQTLLEKFKESLSSSDKTAVKILLKIRIDIVVYAVALFAVVTVVRIIVVAIIKNALEADTLVMKIINKTAGLLLSLVMFAALWLIVFQILFLTKGGADGALAQKLQGSFFRLDHLYTHNPLTAIEKLWK